MAEIAYEGVSKVFDDGTRAVKDLDLTIEDGELMVVVGPSGCGKTTALRMLAGLEEISDGTIRIGDVVVNDLTPKERDIAMVFQNYALYPHMTVEQNLAFGLKLRKVPKPSIRERVGETAQKLEIRDFLKRKPRALSGGQRQRVAMGRAIVRNPQAFLMDEPLSNLDAKLRVQMRAEIHQLQRRLGVTTLYVTHDQVEAMTMGDRVAVMRSGHLQQVDTPQVLYDQPVNDFVAGFIGSPAINMVEADLQRDDGRLVVRFGDHALSVDEQLASRHSGLADRIGKKVVLGIRPEHIQGAGPETNGDGRRIDTVVDLIEPLGADLLVYFTVAAPGVVAGVDEALADDAVRLDAEEDGEGGAGTRMVARVDPRLRIAEGQKVELAVDTRRLYFFDPESGEAV